MSQLSTVFVVVLLTLGLAHADLNLRKQDSPAKIDVSSRSLFGPFPGTFCRAEIFPIGALAGASPCSCKDGTPVPNIRGPFANTTCFSLTLVTTTAFQLKVTCTDETLSNFVSQNLRVAVSDAAPVCRNYSIAVPLKGESRFFLLASDPDDSFLQYHIRSASLVSLRGMIKYCLGCGPTPSGSPDIPSNWYDYQLLINNATESRYSRMFSYTPPSDAGDGFSETIAFSSIDATSQECNTDGSITFKVESVVPPSMKPLSMTKVYVGRPQLLRFSATSNIPVLRFVLKSVPPKTCAIICPISEAARVTLRDFDGEDLSGQILEPCTQENALHAGADITLSSSKDTFFSQTFLTVKAISSCSFDQASSDPVTFQVAASADGVESTPATQSLQVVEVVQRCIPLELTFTPSAPLRFKVSRFVTSPGSLTLTTLTNADFELQSSGSQLSGTQAAADSDLAFIATNSVDVTVMVSSNSPRWTGYCRISFRKESSGATSSPVQTSAAPVPSPNVAATPVPILSETTIPQSSYFGTETFWAVIVIFIIAGVYINRQKLFRLFGTAATVHPPRRYGVVASGEAED